MNLDSSLYSNRLKIEKFSWEYMNRTISLSFPPGFNILGGSDPTMRTTVLRLIRYAMGGYIKGVKRDIRENSNNVVLEMLAGDDRITLIRRCKNPKARITIFDEDGLNRLDYLELAAEYLMRKLNLPKLIKKSRKMKTRLSFNDLARSFVVDRDISYSGILPEVPDKDRVQIMEIMLGFIDKKTQKIQNEQELKKKEIKKLEREIQSLKEFLGKMKVYPIKKLEEHEQRYKFKRNQLMKQEIELKRQIKQNTRKNLGSTYDRLRKDLLEKKEMLKSMETEINTIKYQRKRKLDLKKRLKAELDKIRRYFSSESVLSTFTFSVCPRCLQEINEEMRERENQDMCMLCGRELRKREFDMDSWKKSLMDINQNLKEIDELIDFYDQNEERFLSQIEPLKDEIHRIESEIEEEARRYVSASIEELGLLSSERVEIEKRLREIEIRKGELKFVEKLEKKDIPKNEKRLGDLRTEIEAIMQQRQPKTKSFIFHFSEFMEKVVPDKFKFAEWDERDFLPLVNGEHFRSEVSNYFLVSTVLAFHYALLAMKFKEPRVDANHPGLLLIDEPKQQLIPKETYSEIMTLLKELAESYKDSVQIIIAATDIPPGMEKYIIELDI
jgi:hypothetical protein